MVAVLALIAPSYLLGTFPTAALVARARGRDVYREGSGNPGTSNVYRLLGAGPAALVMAGDIVKGALPALAGLWLWGHAGAYTLGGAAVVGHVFPVTHRFHGGRGVATGGGLVLVLYPVVALSFLAAWLLLARLLKRASVASIAVAVALPLAVWGTGGAPVEVMALGGLALFVLVRHAANLRRLLRREELTVTSAGEERDTGSEPA